MFGYACKGKDALKRNSPLAWRTLAIAFDVKLRYIALLIFALLAVACRDMVAATPTTVEQFEQFISKALATTESDKELASQLSRMVLTQRLNRAKVSHWKALSPGPETKQAILLLADTSAFLDSPASDAPTAAPPDIEVQRKIIALTVQYVTSKIHSLPNLTVNKVTASFDNRNSNGLHATGTSQTTTIYQDGHEQVDWNAADSTKPPIPGLASWGEFGPILASTLIDAAKSRLEWSHWEQADTGLVAIFRYSVLKEFSHYEMHYCCFRYAFHQLIGYHGEISIDAGTGAIMRLVLEADLKNSDPITRADTVIEYGNINLDGREYTCPVRTISISVAQAIIATGLPIKSATVLLLNDVAFEKYQTF